MSGGKPGTSGFSQDARASVPGASMRGPGGGGPMRFAMERVRPRDMKATARALASLFKGESPSVFGAFAIVLADTSLSLLAPYLVGRAVDAIGASAGGNAWVGAVLALLGAYVGVALGTFSHQWIMASSSQRIVRSLRGDLFAKYLRLPVRYFDDRPFGDAMSRVANDVDSVSATLAQSAVQLMANAATVLGSVAFMLALSPILTLVTLAAAPLLFLLARSVVKSTRPLFREQQHSLGVLSGVIEETFSSLDVVRAFGRERRSIERFGEINGRLAEVGCKAQIRAGFLMPMMNVINNLTFAGIALVGGFLAAKPDSGVSVGVIAGFLGYSRMFVRPLNEIANVFNTLMSAVAGAERVFDALEEGEEAPDRPGAVELAEVRGEVEFRSVRFGYRPDVPVIDGMSFAVPPGSTVALVGPTGAGKTTVVNLLVRFYDPDAGAIAIDGRDIRDYTRRSLRNAFGMVLQDTATAPGTVADNIAFGADGADRGRIERAAAVAHAAPFIERLPQGYDTPLSACPLSQGQRQLLAIARVACRDPAMLILDEATSSVDTRTEVLIRRAMTGLMKGRTCFVIAHRLSTIREADRILVIDAGRIAEAGTHEELVALRGQYFRMYEAQRTGDYE
jgi:ATP-binding cassette subfamily B protein